MKSVGNDLWRAQILNIQEEYVSLYYKEAEIEAFYRLYSRMKDDGMKEGDIRHHFEDAFDIKYAAYYTRKRKAGQKHVL